MNHLSSYCILVIAALSCASFLHSAKKALIFGITGQDGSYLAEFLLDKGYEVHGIIRRASGPNTQRIDHLLKGEHPSGKKIQVHYGCLTDASSIMSDIAKIKPDEIYNLAAQSHVKISFDDPEYSSNVDGLGTLRILEAIRTLGLAHHTRFYQASTSELYGKVQEIPQTELTPFNPQSPYAIAKLYAFYITKNYREAYGIFASNGILFNHESPRRGVDFVTRKITLAAAQRSLGAKNILVLGNLEASRDWGYAKDYVEAMWLMLQQQKPDDFVISTGKTYKVRQFVELVYREIGISLEWIGSGIEEIGIDKNTRETIIQVDPAFFRPTEVDILIGNASKAEKQLGWQPKTSLEELARLMVLQDRELIARQLHDQKENTQCSHPAMPLA